MSFQVEGLLSCFAEEIDAYIVSFDIKMKARSDRFSFIHSFFLIKMVKI